VATGRAVADQQGEAEVEARAWARPALGRRPCSPRPMSRETCRHRFQGTSWSTADRDSRVKERGLNIKFEPLF
jgi:hypothetical protein